MNYSTLQESLHRLSLFELYRLTSIINNELENPQRISEIRNSIAIGSNIEYFDETTNRIVQAIVLQKNQKRLLVSNCHDHKQWWIRYHMLNLSGPIVKPVSQKLDRNSLSVGDRVGFEYEGQKIVGVVIKLNPKTAVILSTDNYTWKVSYTLLFPVIEAIQQFPEIDASSKGT